MSVVDGKKGSGRFSIFGKLSKNASQRGPPPLPPKDPHLGRLAGPAQAAAFRLFKFATISRKNSSPNPSTLDSPAADDDENISMPWNFQHNVHVDEGFSGLPPSWTTSLQEAGFSDDEIAAIQQKPGRSTECASISPAGRARGGRASGPAQHVAAQEPAHPRLVAECVLRACPRRARPPCRDAEPKVDYAAYMQSPPSPKSPPPTYWRDEPQPLTHSHTLCPFALKFEFVLGGGGARPPTQAPPKPLRSLTLDLDLSVGEPWSDAVLSATPWSASARKEAFDANTTSSSDIKHKANTTKEGSFLPSPSPTSPMFTLTAPGGGRLAASMLEAGADNDDDFSPTAAYYTSASSPFVAAPEARQRGQPKTGVRRRGLGDERRDDAGAAAERGGCEPDCGGQEGGGGGC
ncbi:hypothetical protein DFH06DRAFT_1144477 [Mycena polygramma]|nr:hypothetical protein DFH06DRAFT_1144477 [Mycena polygramma]